MSGRAILVLATLLLGSAPGCFRRGPCARDAECAGDGVCYPDGQCLERDVARRAGAVVGDQCTNDDRGCVAPGYCVTGFCVNQPEVDAAVADADAASADAGPDRPPRFDGVLGVAPDDDGTLLLWWEAPSDDRTPEAELELLIYRGQSPGFATPATPHAVTLGTQYRDLGLQNGKTYYYRVHARDSAGQTDQNPAELSGTAEAPPVIAPGVPYATVQAIFEARCVHCHGGTANLHLETLEGVLKGGTHGVIVEPCQPDSSSLLGKLSSQPPFGARMPRDGPPYLPLADRATLRRWIADGAAATPTPGLCP
ncbi:MAG: hypothetical protein IT370_32650 [Deltaproteobacteria bacterium]|nr:hypothetical protein [Deltaproteobacteria bacterium]